MPRLADPETGLLAFLATPVDPRAATERAARCPANGREWLRFLLVSLQLVALVLVIDQFQIESRAFASVALVVLGGFLVHSLLPVRYRLACFAAISVLALVLILQPQPSVWVLGIGGVLVGLCCLPLPIRLRVALVAAAGIGLAVLRGDGQEDPWPSVVWPVLGSMLMFRLIVFLYDVGHGEKPRSVWETIAYFAMLPNVCFPLFPVVDYKAFRSTYYREDAWHCSQTGLRWISRGLIHLLLYRAIYYWGVLAPSEVNSAGDLFRYAVTTWALYLRVSGNFHVIIGVLRLFGFALPETHFLYFLSAGVNDFWRRINIYWKDFMLRVFYFPAFFRLRKSGETRAFVLATVWVVVLTWFLHSYQWFWLRGTFPLRWQDGVFWVLLGALMVVNTLHEQRHSKARGRRARTFTVRDWLRRSVTIVATFVFIATLWSLWTVESFDEWLGMWQWSGAGGTTPLAWSIALPAGVLVFLIGGAALGMRPTATAGAGAEREFRSNAVLTIATLLGLLALGTPQIYGLFGRDVSEVVQKLRVAKPNRLDGALLQRGYYEDLQDVDRFNPALWQAFRSKPAAWRELRETDLLRRTGDFLLTELEPAQEVVYKEALLRTNSFGMRDREYEKVKPAGTWRMVITGASYVMGSGVADDEVFEAVVEDRLNREHPAGPQLRYEILNLAVGGYSPMQRVQALEQRGLLFAPDVAVYVAHELETFRIFRHLSSARRLGIEIPYPELQAICDRAGVEDGMADDVFEKRLEPHAREILAWTYRHFVQVCREHDVVPVWVLLPTLEMHAEEVDASWLIELARDAGCEVIELFGVYDGNDIFSIRVADWDYHPNAAGHRLIADRLYRELAARRRLLGAR